MTASISFMVLSLPYSAFDLLRKFDFQFEFLKNRKVLRFVLLLVDINHATNFILYCITGQRFREELKAIYCYDKNKIPNRNHKVISNGCNRETREASNRPRLISIPSVSIWFYKNLVLGFNLYFWHWKLLKLC